MVDDYKLAIAYAITDARKVAGEVNERLRIESAARKLKDEADRLRRDREELRPYLEDLPARIREAADNGLTSFRIYGLPYNDFGVHREKPYFNLGTKTQRLSDALKDLGLAVMPRCSDACDDWFYTFWLEVSF